VDRFSFAWHHDETGSENSVARTVPIGPLAPSERRSLQKNPNPRCNEYFPFRVDNHLAFAKTFIFSI